MESLRAFALLILSVLPITARGWGVDGHFITCKIAEGLLSLTAEDAVNQLLPDDDLDYGFEFMKDHGYDFRPDLPLLKSYTPDNVCTYQYNRDCKDNDGAMGNCVAGAIINYTTQLLDYGKPRSQNNLTEALLFLCPLVGDIHEPLEVGFTTDQGGNKINVVWFSRKTTLRDVWDNGIIETAKERFYGSNLETYIKAIQTNITEVWGDQVETWIECDEIQNTCLDMYTKHSLNFMRNTNAYTLTVNTFDSYATESIKAACKWAYNGVKNNSVLGDEYFLSSLPIVNLRLAQGGVRLSAILNQIFV